MRFDSTININGKDYEFVGDEEFPLRYIMKINDSYEIIRDINCDIPTERWSLVHIYDSVRNGVVKKNDTFSTDVYHGKDIESEIFMKELLEHVLYGIINEV